MSDVRKIAIFDFNRTIYDPDISGLMPGALESLTALRDANVALYLVSKAGEGRSDTVADLGIEHFFTGISFVHEKTPDIFLDIIHTAGGAVGGTYLIGDHLHKEIRTGNRAGIKTIHFKNGKFAGLLPESPDDTPWRTITNLSEAVDLILLVK